MDVPDLNLQPLNMDDDVLLDDSSSRNNSKNEEDPKTPHRKTSFARSMSVPNSVVNTLIFPNQEEAIPSVTISDFSSHDHVSNPKGLSRHNSLPKTDRVRFCCPKHHRHKPSLSPALSMSDLMKDEEFTDAEPETP